MMANNISLYHGYTSFVIRKSNCMDGSVLKRETKHTQKNQNMIFNVSRYTVTEN